VVLAFVVSALCLVIPGLLITWATKVQGFDALALAPVVSLFCLGSSALIGGQLGLRWGWWMPLGFAVVLAAILAVIVRPTYRRRLGGREPEPQSTITAALPVIGNRKFSGAAWIGLALGVAVGIWQTAHITGGMEHFSQAFDNTFHLNAVRYIADHGNASPLFVGTLNAGGSPGFFYPSVWHSLGAILVTTTGISVPAATNVVTFCTTALVWPISIMFLIRSLTRNRYSWLVAGALSGAFVVFPVLLQTYGILYPNLLGNAAVPAGLGLVVWALRGGPDSRLLRPQALTLGAIAGIGISLSHPNAIVSLIAVAVPATIARITSLVAGMLKSTGSRSLPAAPERRRHPIPEILLLLVCLAAVPVVWTMLRPKTFQPETIKQIPVSGSVLDALSLAPSGYSISWVIVGFIVVSAAVLLYLRRHAWMVFAYAILVVLYIAVESMPWEWRDALTGVWYNDPYRLTALFPVIGIPMIAIAVGWAVQELYASISGWRAVGVHRPLEGEAEGWMPPRPKARPALAQTAKIVLGLVAVVAVSVPIFAADSMKEGRALAHERFETTPSSELVTSDELDVLHHVPDYVPRDDTLMVNPWTGGSLAYALTGQKVSSYHLLETRTPEIDRLDKTLNTALADPNVCQDVEHVRGYYVLDFGTREMNGVNHASVYGGLRGLEQTGVAQTVYQTGNARLLEVTACG
jgi:hypothetical protein